MDDQDTNILKDSLWNPVTRWIDSDKSYEQRLRRINLHPDSKIWYQSINHSLWPIAHNEIVNEARLVLLHCITTFSTVNMVKIIIQEIQDYSKKKK